MMGLTFIRIFLFLSFFLYLFPLTGVASLGTYEPNASMDLIPIGEQNVK